MAQEAQGRTQAAPGGNHEIGSAALGGVGHLLGADRHQPGGRHAGTAQHPLRLQESGAGDHRHPVAAALAAGFEQQRDVEHHEGDAASRVPAQERALGGADQRMQDGLQPLERRPVAEDPPPQLGAVDGAAGGDARKRRLDRRHRLATRAQQGMGGGVGIVHGDAQAPQHGRRRALAHADGAGETEDLHHEIVTTETLTVGPQGEAS